MKMFKQLIPLLLILPLAACGQAVEVKPASVGKILTSNGYLPDTITPSKFRLSPCLAFCDKLITADASDLGLKETFRLFMPKDQLNMSFDIRMIASIRKDNKSLDAIFGRITPDELYHISASRVYETYIRPVIRDAVRATIAQYSINQIASSREVLNAEITAAVEKALVKAPMRLKRIGLADIQFPAIITKQKEIAAQRRIEIEEAEAKKQIKLVNLQTELEAAKAQRAIRLVKAKAAKEENEIYAASMSEKYLAYKQLEVLEQMASNPNTVFVPFKALDNVGLSQRLFTRKQ